MLSGNSQGRCIARDDKFQPLDWQMSNQSQLLMSVSERCLWYNGGPIWTELYFGHATFGQGVFLGTQLEQAQCVRSAQTL